MASGTDGQIRIIAGKWRGRKIKILNQKDLRPTPDRVRETLFNWLQTEVSGALCLDLFAGSGVLGFEAVSRGARKAVLVDNSDDACNMIRQNINALEPRSVQLVTSDATSFIEKNTLKYDVVFLDPPYQSDGLSRICSLLEHRQCLAEHAKIYIEHHVKTPMPDLPDNWHVLKNKSAGQVTYYLVERLTKDALTS